MQKRLLLTCLLFYTFFALKSQYYPDSTWQTKSPAEAKMNAALIDSAIKFAINNESKTDYDLRIACLKAYANEPNFRILGPTRERGKPSGLIIKSGYIIAQWGDVTRADMTFSVTKSFLSTVAGLAYDKRLIKNVNEKVSRYVQNDYFTSQHNAKITWQHLLTQTSDWSGCLFDVCDWADRPPKEGTIDEWKSRKLLEPGTNFEYNDVRVNLLAYALLEVWRKPLPVVLKESIMDPIGASTSWRWYGYENSFVNIDGIMMQSVSGGGHFGGGMFISSLDQARFGLLFRRKGKWKNKQLISEAWINEAVKPSEVNKSYGYMWWTNEDDRLKDLSKKIYYAEGFGGNTILIDHENDLVIVSRWLEPSRLSDFVNMVVSSINR